MLGSLSLFSLLHLSGMKFSNPGKCWDILPITITGILTCVCVNKIGGLKDDNDEQS